jgi:pyridoxal phosphate enzyme (YggS family)
LKTIRQNIEEVRKRIADAAASVGRSPEEVTLVAVTKLRTPQEIAQALAAGVKTFGENRVQEAKSKAHLLPEGISWHMIGHLQTNKAKDAVALFECIHSLDSIHLADEVEKRCAAADKTMNVLLEVNVSGEESKYGLRPDDVEGVVRHAITLPHLRLKGLMTMAPFVDHPETVRPVFRGLRELRDRINDKGICRLTDLSMGMTQDYQVAVQEGATIVRIGSAIFNAL